MIGELDVVKGRGCVSPFFENREGMRKATCNGQIIAESAETYVFEVTITSLCMAFSGSS